MDTQVADKAKSMAKRSLVLGLVSIGLLVINIVTLLYAGTFPPMGLTGPRMNLFLLSACLILAGIVIVISGFIAGLIVIIRNKDDVSARRTAIVGMVLNIASVLGAWIIVPGW